MTMSSAIARTLLGDAIELRALNSPSTILVVRPVLVGSAKPNIDTWGQLAA